MPHGPIISAFAAQAWIESAIVCLRMNFQTRPRRKKKKERNKSITATDWNAQRAANSPVTPPPPLRLHQPERCKICSALPHRAPPPRFAKQQWLLLTAARELLPPVLYNNWPAFREMHLHNTREIRRPCVSLRSRKDEGRGGGRRRR